MSVNIDDIKQICDTVSAQTKEAYERLSLYFIVHGAGQLEEIAALSEHEILSHPAGETALNILRKHPQNPHSNFLGLAIANHRKWLGLVSKDSVLGLFNINVDDFKSKVEARAHVYHLAWHAIDIFEIRQRPQYRRKYRQGPMVPKRSALNLSKANLQADVFAACLCELQGKGGFLETLGKMKGEETLIAQSHYKPEHNPYLIAMETARFALDDLKKSILETTDLITTARQLSLQIGQAFDESNIKNWWNFAVPAQEMAWQNTHKEDILSAAMNTSKDPFVKANAFLVQEVTDLSPSPSENLEKIYNAYLDHEKHEKLHREMVDVIFEETFAQVIETEDGTPFIKAANAQNEVLTEGRILGWCASALHAAAKAFENALVSGVPADQAARLEFEGMKGSVDWQTLKQLSSNIIEQRRAGYAVTMGNVVDICNENPAFAPVLKSMTVTMNDPSYIRKLEAANDLANIPKPQGPAVEPGPKAEPQKPAPSAPTAHMAPSLGGSKSPAFRQRQKQLQEQREQKSSSDKSDDHNDKT